MKKILSKAMAIALCLAIIVSAAMFIPQPASANVYGPDRITNIQTLNSIVKDYKKAYARNKELWNAQRTDSDAIEKNKIGSDDKDIIELAKRITASSKDDYSKMRAIHDWVATNIYYDYPAYRGEVNKTGDVASAKTPFVVLERKRAVCGGYAITTVALLRAVGIPAKTVSGVVTTDSKIGHAWSQAWLSSEKRWVIMDTTWDSGNKYDNGKYTKGSMRTKYFDISLAELSHSHLLTNTSEVWNKIMWYPNIKGQPNTYIAVPYMSGLTWKNPGTNPGHKFAGWFKEPEFKTPWNFNKDKAATDVNLYAKWNPETYTVKFDSNGGSAVPSVQVGYDSRLTKPKDPTRAGYVFAGWTFKKNGTEFWNFIREPYISTVKGNTTLYASWQKPYTITFDSCGGTPVSSKKTGLNGLVPKPNETPNKEGYTFAGWYYKKNAKDADRPVYFGEAKVNKDTTLYARWTPGGSKTGTTTTETPKPTSTETPTPTQTPKTNSTPKPSETQEEALVPSKVEPITSATDTNKNTIKEGWYYLVCQNNYIRVNNKEALLTKEDYANQFHIRHLGGTLYSIRSMFGTYLSTESIEPRSGDKVPAKLIKEDNSSVDGWVINIDPKTNVCTIHPLNNKKLVISGSGNKVVLADATKVKDAAKITLVPRE